MRLGVFFSPTPTHPHPHTQFAFLNSSILSRLAKQTKQQHFLVTALTKDSPLSMDLFPMISAFLFIALLKELYGTKKNWNVPFRIPRLFSHVRLFIQKLSSRPGTKFISSPAKLYTVGSFMWPFLFVNRLFKLLFSSRLKTIKDNKMVIWLLRFRRSCSVTFTDTLSNYQDQIYRRV